MESPQQSAPSAPGARKGGGGMKRCPYCGAKNKASFEYCVRCSEPLDETAPEGQIAQGRAALSKLVVGAVVCIGVLVALAAVRYFVAAGAPEPTAAATTGTAAPAEAPARVTEPLPDIDSQEVLDDFNEGLRAYNARDYETAASHFEVVARELPDNPSAFQYLGLSYYYLESYDDALDALEEARRLRPDSFELLTHYVKVAKQADRVPVAAEVLRDFVADHPENRPARLELARLARDLGDTDEAVSQAEALASADQSSPELSYEYGVSLKDAGRYEEAKAVLKSTIELDPDSALAHHALGVTELLSGSPSSAIGPLETAVAKAPSNGDFRFSLAQAYEKADRISESLQAYEAYLEHADAGDPRAKVVRERLAVAKKALAERSKGTSGDRS